MATLTITHTESLTLGDGSGSDRGTTNTQTLTVTEVDHRIVTAGLTAVSFLKFGVMPGAGTYKDGTVKYLRITNLDSTNFVKITVRQSDAEYCVKLEAEGSDEGTNSFILGPSVMDAHEDGDTGTASPTFANIDDILIGADTAACLVEIFVATTT